MTVDRDRDRVDAELAEAGMWLEKDLEGTVWVWTVYWYKFGVLHEREVFATGSTWREAASNALGRPAF